MRGLGKRPINSVKNIIDGVFLAVAGGTITTVTLAQSVNDYVGGATELPTGGTIKGIYLFVQMNQTAVVSNVDWYIWKGSANLSGTMPVPGATSGDLNRRYILHEEKGIPGQSDNGAPPLTFRGVIKIPRGRQRFGEADVMQLRLRGAGIHNACVKCIYKFYF